MRRLPLKMLSLSLIALCSMSMAQAEDLLQRVTQKKQIVVATEARFAPFESVENGTTRSHVDEIVMWLAIFLVLQSVLTRYARYRSQVMGELVLAELREDFVAKFANSDTLLMPPDVRLGLSALYTKAQRRGFIARLPRLDIVDPQPPRAAA